VVIHAAALKIIPLAEYNPFECIQTNVAQRMLSNQHCAPAESPCRPIKRPIRLTFTALQNWPPDKIMFAANNLSVASGAVFSVVRYGNVPGSRGSVVPLFQRLVGEGAKWLPITHPNVTRFWISLDQGISFVLSCLTIMKGGGIFIPKIPSMRITDLARVKDRWYPSRRENSRGHDH
jgi:UDP-N-acetylglucosamine 4,6-dehydratase